MFTLIFAEIFQGFKRIWKLYLTNILSIMFIILLFGYIDGSRRQLNLQKTAFSGELVVRMDKDIPDTEGKLAAGLKDVEYVAQKIRASVQFRLPGNDSTGRSELVGVNLAKDRKLLDYLTLKEGRVIEDAKDILVPTSIWQKTDINLGDVILITGKNADEIFNVARFKVCGFYNSPSLTLFDSPRFLVSYEAMEEFYMPRVKDVEYCIFFKNGEIAGAINKEVRDIFNDTDRSIVKSIDAVQVSTFDVLNISVQMGVFLILLIMLTIIVIVTIVMLVNFNIYMILFRKRQKQLGTLMTFGVPSWKVGVTFFLESLFQVVLATVIATALASLIAVLARQQIASGFLEVLVVLLSGTNRIDFFIKLKHVLTAFGVILAAVTVAQIPIFFKVYFSNPIEVMSGR